MLPSVIGAVILVCAFFQPLSSRVVRKPNYLHFCKKGRRNLGTLPYITFNGEARIWTQICLFYVLYPTTFKKHAILRSPQYSGEDTYNPSLWSSLYQDSALHIVPLNKCQWKESMNGFFPLLSSPTCSPLVAFKSEELQYGKTKK